METEIIHSGPANYFRGIESVGGKLFLYKDRLHFESHGMAIQAAPHTIYLADIQQVEKKNSLGIIPNQILVRLTNGKSDKFVVQKREVWLEKIQAILPPKG